VNLLPFAIWTLVTSSSGPMTTVTDGIGMTMSIAPASCEASFEIINLSEQPLIFPDVAFPWKNRDMSRWVAVEYATIASKLIEGDSNVWDYFGIGDVTIPPGQRIAGKVDLSLIFSKFGKSRNQDVVIFVRYGCSVALCGKEIIFTGSAMLPREARCNNFLIPKPA